uniref:Integrase n=1 Tax=Heterorhabditis bacteriophora TaxID=37862 RepID=A0A1I7XGK8_HETBA
MVDNFDVKLVGRRNLQVARKAMDFLWAQRHRASDLMGTVLNVHSGDWVRRVMRYVNKGPLFVDVHMHRPTVATRSFMDWLNRCAF